MDFDRGTAFRGRAIKIAESCILRRIHQPLIDPEISICNPYKIDVSDTFDHLLHPVSQARLANNSAISIDVLQQIAAWIVLQFYGILS